MRPFPIREKIEGEGARIFWLLGSKVAFNELENVNELLDNLRRSTTG
jgi:hypothetical protein